MNREDVIRWMHEVGAKESNPTPQTYDGFVDIFQQFAALVAAAEREACARVCDAEVAQINLTSGSRAALVAGMVAEICAEAIRARGE